MRLFFLRHGIAEPGHTGLRDFDRQLTPAGEAELESVARGLKRLKVTPDPLIASPSLRAQQTAEEVAPVLGGTVGFVDERQRGASLEACAGLERGYSGADCIMFVGHEPDLSEAA